MTDPKNPSRARAFLPPTDITNLQLLIDSVREYEIILLDAQGVVQSWNVGAERMKGYAADEIIGQSFRTFYPPEDIAAGKPEFELEVAKAEGRYEDTGWRVRKDGTRFWANAVITALWADDGTLRGFGKVTRDVTERRIAETILRESEERNRLFVSAVKDYAIIFLTPNGTVASWNEGAERIKGYRREEVVGRHLSLFYTPEDRTTGKAEVELRTALETGRFEEEGWRVRKDGTRFRANVVLTPVRDSLGTLTGFAKVTRDVTHTKSSEEALRQSEERFRLMVDSVRDYAIFTLTPDGTVASWNQGAERITGYAPSEVIGRHVSIFYTARDIESRKADFELRIATAEGRYEEEGWRLRKDGTAFWANVVLSVQRDDSGVVRGFTKVTRDMTEKKRASDALVALTHKLRRSNEELERFASIASHDLQEPLRKILAFGDQLRLEFRDALGDEGKFYVDRMGAAAKRMRTLIDDLLAFSRVTSQPRQAIRVDLNDVLKDVLFDLETRVTQLGATVRSERLPVIEGDPVQMRQLLQNLIGNALKFHREGVAPVVTLSARRRDVPEGSVPVHELLFRDNGIGFDEKYKDRIFNLFERLHSRDEYEGTGLGLSICRRIAERQGGSIDVSSKPGEGTEFVVSLPERPLDPERSDDERA